METLPLEEHALDSLVAGLVHLDAGAVRQVMAGRRPDASSPVTELLVPAYSELRRRHRIGDIDRVTLGVATELVRREIFLADSDPSKPRLYPVSDHRDVRTDRPRIVVTCPSGVDHLLAAEAAGEVLGALGWPVDVVTDAGGQLAGHLAARSALALVVSCTDESGLPEVARAVDAAHGEGIPVVVTGPALGSDGLRALRLRADVWIPSVEGLAVVLDGWRLHKIPVAPPHRLPDELAALETARAATVASALATVGAGSAADDQVRSLVDDIVGYLAAAVLVDDSRILVDRVALPSGRGANGALDDVVVVALVDAVAAALPPELDRARRFISEARESLRRTMLREVQPSGVPTELPVRAAPAGIARRPPDEAVSSAMTGGASSPGQAFADLLLLGALACQAPVALLSVPQADGQWSTLSYGFEHRQGLNDPLLLDAMVRRNEAVEFADMSTLPEVAHSPLIGAPHNLRWAYGAALRAPDGVVLGVFCVLDRWLRQLTRREQRATLAVARQMAAQLSAIRKAPGRPGWEGAVTSEGAPSVPFVPAPPSLVGLRRSGGLSDGQQLLRSHEVAVLFDVTERTVINWAAAGKLPSLRTIGGHLRFRSVDVQNLLAGRGIIPVDVPVG